MSHLKGFFSEFAPGPPAAPGKASPQIVRFLTESAEGNEIIDLGGGNGAYSFEMKRNGFNPVVVDVDARALAIAEANGLATRHLSEGERLEPSCCDTVIMVEVLEHVSDPVEFLKNALQAARYRLLFTIPCTNDFNFLFSMGLSYAHIAVSDHLLHFADKDLIELLNSTGNRYEFYKAEPLFPTTAIRILRNSFRWRWMGKLFLLPFKTMYKMGILKAEVPIRYYGVIYK